MDLSLVLAIVAAILAVVTLIQTRAASLLAWGILALALIHLLPALT